jgi:hypothetical protein
VYYWKWLLILLFWWRRLAAPGPVTKFKAKVKHMTDVKLSWKDPVVRADGTDLAASELTGIELFMRVAGAPDFTKLTTVAAGVQTFTVVGLEPGDYEFQADAVDAQVPPKVSTVVTTSITIAAPELAAPGEPTEFAATAS